MGRAETFLCVHRLGNIKTHILIGMLTFDKGREPKQIIKSYALVIRQIVEPTAEQD